jgi:ketosteroid isomerase-like protein
MLYRFFILSACVLALCISSFAAPNAATSTVPDKAYLQKLLDGWGTLDSSNMKPYYAQDDRLFFDIAPVKYNNWAEYQAGTTDLFKNYKSLKMTLGDDTQIHHDGNLVWAASTVKEDAMTAGGKHELGTFRWTILFQKMDGKWLVVHEHTSLSAQ